MTPIKLKREMFPNLPDEVWNIFIVPLNDDRSNIFDTHVNGRWFVHFGGLSIEAFSKLQWNLTILPTNEILDNFTITDIDRILSYCNIKDSPYARARFIGYDPSIRTTVAKYTEFIAKARRLPAPIVGIRTNAKFKVLDGNHRLATLFDLGLYSSIPIDAWIGE